jgi:gliding motility-associated-like protein
VISTSTNAEYMFFNEGCFIVKLIAQNLNQCTDSTQRNICVNTGFNFYAPNAFTPNGDGQNDVFFPKGTDWKPSDYTFEILDRWGLTMFRTHDINAAWDGNFNGGAATPDVYAWSVIVYDIYGFEHDFSGKVVLIR